MKNILNLNGVKMLNKTEQKEILGGVPSLSCFGKNIGDSCGTPSSPNSICCATGGDNSYLYCSQQQNCNALP